MKALINLEFVQGCENNCPACVEMDKHRTLKFMSKENFKNSCNKIKKVFDDDLFFRVFGIGNSLLHPMFTDYCKYLHEIFPNSLVILTAEPKDVIKYSNQIGVWIDRVITTFKFFDTDLNIAEPALNLLKSKNVNEIRLGYLTPAFTGHERIIRKIAKLGDNLLGCPSIISRYMPVVFGYNKTPRFDGVMNYYYEEEIQYNTEEHAKEIIGEDLFYYPFKGFKNGVSLLNYNKSIPAFVYDYSGELQICLLCESFISNLKEYVNKYERVIRKESCDICRVGKEDFSMEVSTKPIKLRYTTNCACYGSGTCICDCCD